MPDILTNTSPLIAMEAVAISLAEKGGLRRWGLELQRIHLSGL
ncbi:hypothetical protein [uncultured Thiodictyon sp.]|jgi:hypothetical protein|nr:hypothetical protein [uncultured Thiodictyon sp.]